MFPTERLSRFLSYLLRHRPQEYPIAFDRHGFAPWAEVVDTVRERFREVTEEQMCAVVIGSDKQRFELKDGKVRATYGHSFPVDLGLEPVEPPRQLYFGTARDLAQSIFVAHTEGVRFFASGPLFLAEHVSSKFLSLDQK